MLLSNSLSIFLLIKLLEVNPDVTLSGEGVAVVKGGNKIKARDSWEDNHVLGLRGQTKKHLKLYGADVQTT